MSERVSFVTIEDLDDGIDLIVSFAFGPYAKKGLTLLRTPAYEALLPADERYHCQAKIKLPGMTAHCAIHAIVENQLAMKLDFVEAASDRLMKQGLTRHDAVHAIGSQVAERFVDASRDPAGDDGHVTNARYKASIERLSAASWGRVAK